MIHNIDDDILWYHIDINIHHLHDNHACGRVFLGAKAPHRCRLPGEQHNSLYQDYHQVGMLHFCCCWCLLQSSCIAVFCPCYFAGTLHPTVHTKIKPRRIWTNTSWSTCPPKCLTLVPCSTRWRWLRGRVKSKMKTNVKISSYPTFPHKRVN